MSIFSAPVSVVRAGRRARRIKEFLKTRSKRKSAGTKRTGNGSAKSAETSVRPANDTADREPAEKKTASGEKSTATPSQNPSERKAAEKTSAKPKAPAAKAATITVEKKQTQVKHEAFSSLYQNEEAIPVVLGQQEASETADEDTPKSKPIHETDQYIRKRLLVDGIDSCDQAIISRLSVGAHLQFSAEPENPRDKNIVTLFCEGTKIGYVAREDALPFATCLRLGKEVYGVVTGIVETQGKLEIEYETWFVGKRY